MLREFEDKKELCLECKHTRRFHNSVHKDGACSQPTCSCCCFIESGVYYGMDLFEAFEAGNKLEGYCNKCKKVQEPNPYCSWYCGTCGEPFNLDFLESEDKTGGEDGRK